MTHPVIQHILARRGKHVPQNDGRTIGLVAYGGSMSGVIGGGAMIALEELGLSHAFDHIICNSAGFANASYLLADSTHIGATIYFEECASRKFINFFRFWNIVDIDFLIDVMRTKKILHVDRIASSETKLYVELHSTRTHKEQYLEVHTIPPDHYFEIMHAATAIHYLHPGGSFINGIPYMDIRPYTRSKHIQQAQALGCTDILVIYNRIDQQGRDVSPSEQIVEVLPDKDWQVKPYEQNPEILRAGYRNMGRRIKQIFGVDGGISFNMFTENDIVDVQV